MQPNYIKQKYLVRFEDYTIKHYEKDFKKKYKRAWPATKESIIETLERISNLNGLNIIDYICKSNKNTYLLKFDFAIAQNHISPKASGHRCIISVCNESLTVTIILIYSKHNIERSGGQETIWWKNKIKDEFGLVCMC